MADHALTRAAAQHAQAIEEFNQGRPTAALQSLRRAQRLLPDADPGASDAAGRERTVLAARILISISACEFELAGADAGLSALAQAQRLAAGIDEPRVQVLLHCQRGLIELRRGDLRAAATQFDLALPLIEHAVPRDQFSLRLNRGTVALARGDLAAARADLAAATDLAQDAQLAVGRFKALHNLGYVEFLAGDLPLALRLIDEAGEIDADVSRGIWLLDRARVLGEAGLIREADTSLAAAGEVLAADGLTQDVAETEVERARCALVVGDLESARRFAGTARQSFRARGSEQWQRTAELVVLQADLAAGRADGQLAAAAMRLHDTWAAAGLRLPARAAALVAASAYVAAGDLRAADACLTRLGRARRDDPITGRLHSHHVHALVDRSHGRAAAASRRARRALDELAGYQARFGSIDLRTAAAVHGRRLAELSMSLALGTGRPASVYAAAERARAVSSRLPMIRPPADPISAQLLADLRQTVESLRGVEQNRAASERLLRRRRELEREIASRGWAVAGAAGGAGPPSGPAPLERVRAELAERSLTMLMYVQADQQLTAVVVDRRIRMQELGPSAPIVELIRRVRADLDVLAQRRLPPGIRASARASLDRSLLELDTALAQPLRTSGPLVVVSTGVLGQLPWAALPAMAARPIVIAPSATRWLASTGIRPQLRLRVAAVAGPDLARSGAEVLGVGAAWQGASRVQVRAGAAATTQALTSVMSTASLLHVAAHGVHQPENPLFSSLRMADGSVFAHELDRLPRVPDHVVLSACEVGLATIRPGDEALGLASVLLQLGTGSVVAGVARVRDEIAESTMATYHANLAAGLDSSAALAHALADLDAEVPAPFVHFGGAWQARATAKLNPPPVVA